MNTALVVGNWKMNTNVSEAIKLASNIRDSLNRFSHDNVETVICPPFVSLVPVLDLVKGSSIKLGAQNSYSHANGAFTGEISPSMLVDICEYVIIGHSERRHIINESNELIANKIQAVLNCGLRPILCVGETLDQRNHGDTEKVIRHQINTSLNNIRNKRDIEGLVIAYEPVWAIGTGVPAKPMSVVATIEGPIHGELTNLYNKHQARNIPILYGGSVSPANVSEYIQSPSIHGTLVGSASLSPQLFSEIVKLTAEVKGLT